MRILNDTTELQIRLRPDEVDPYVQFVLTAPPSRFRRELIEQLRRECLIE